MLPLLLSGEKGEVTISGWFDLKYQQQQKKEKKTNKQTNKKQLFLIHVSLALTVITKLFSLS